MLFTQVLWHANTSTQCFYGHILLRRDYSARIACKHFYTETFWHTMAGAFTCKYFTRQCLFCTCFLFTYIHACSVTGMLSITHAFAQRCFYTETPLHRDTFAQGCFHAQKCFFTHFYREMILREQFYTQMPKQAEVLLQRNVLARGVFTYGHFYTLLNDFRRWTCIWHKRIQQTYAKSHFHHSFWRSRRISWDRVGPAQAHIAIWPQCMMIDISRKRVASRGHQYMLPWCSKRSFRKNQDCSCV